MAGQRQTEDQKPGAESVWKDKYLHLLADLENTKKRLSRSSAQEVDLQKTMLLKEVLEVADGFDLALGHISDEQDSPITFQVVEPLRHIFDNFFSTYEVQKMDAQGAVFDPNLHEALGMIQHPAAVPNTVVKIEKAGYLYQGRLLRPAQVLVAGR